MSENLKIHESLNFGIQLDTSDFLYVLV